MNDTLSCPFCHKQFNRDDGRFGKSWMTEQENISRVKRHMKKKHERIPAFAH